jgi:hypothetical protein
LIREILLMRPDLRGAGFAANKYTAVIAARENETINSPRRVKITPPDAALRVK